MKKRSGFQIMARLIGLVRPLAGYMMLAVLMGLIGHLAATFITVFGGYAVADLLGLQTPFTLGFLFAAVIVFALTRGLLRYAEQACNHFIAFKLLALIRERVFCALRRLCPAKLEGRDRGDLIAVITSDVELLEVLYAHTISPIVIAVLFSALLCAFIGRFHPLLGALALHDWFLGTKIYRNHLESYVRGRGMTVRTKVRLLLTVTALMGIGFVMMLRKALYLPCGILACVWATHIVYFGFRVKTIDGGKD